MPTSPPPATRARAALGARVREVRRSRGLSQMTLGAEIGLDHKTISRLENGHRSVSLDELVLLARGLGVRVTDLLRDVDT